MFDFLKKKIGGFVDKLTQKEEGKEPEPKKAPEEKSKPPEKTTPKPKKAEPKKAAPKAEKKPAAKPVPKKPEVKKEAPKPVEKPKKVEKKPAPAEKVGERQAEKPAPSPEKPPEVKKEVPEEEPGRVEETPEIDTGIVDEPAPEVEAPKEPGQVEEEQVPEPVEETPQEPEAPPKEEKHPKGPGPEFGEKPEPLDAQEIEGPQAEIEQPEPPGEVSGPVEEVPEEPKEKPRERIKIGAFGAIKSFITRQVEISDADVGELLEEFELELLEADVDMSVAESIKDELREKLIGSKVKKDELHQFINNTMRETLIDMLYNENAFDILTKVKESEKPVKIMFLGINGAGKTTTIAKVAKLLLDNKQKVVFAAADTFRAAAIEQMQVHAERLDVKVIKRDYGSDPTSVAYDAMNYAKAHGIDAVLIDTAGRQDTNISLINEMKKMTRVIEPQMKVYIGESIAGNAIIEQISSFNKEIGIDAVILTKLDCDPKGGTMLSINKVTGVPIIYVGMGQEYGDLEIFDAERIVSRIVE